MNRQLSYLLGPELVLVLFTIATYWFCSRHNSGEGRDVEIMSGLVWAVPFIIAPVVFATVLVPGSKNVWWLGRAIFWTFVAVFICGFRIIDGFGTGSKGQDGAMILLVVMGSVAVGLGVAITGAMILSASRPGFAQWFQSHKLLAPFLTLLSAVPIGIAIGFVVTLVGGILLGLYVEIFKR